MTSRFNQVRDEINDTQAPFFSCSSLRLGMAWLSVSALRLAKQDPDDPDVEDSLRVLSDCRNSCFSGCPLIREGDLYSRVCSFTVADVDALEDMVRGAKEVIAILDAEDSDPELDS